MARFSWILVFVFVLSLGAARGIHAELGFEPTLSSYWIHESENRTLDQVSEQFEIVRKRGHEFEIYVPETKLKSFLKIAPMARLGVASVRGELLQQLNQEELYFADPIVGPMADSSTTDKAAPRYRSFDEVVEYLKELNNRFPEITELKTYGRSRQGRLLYYLKVSDNASDDESEPEYMLSAATHGDEIITVEVLLGLLDRLLNGYGNDRRMTDLIDNKQIYFLPMVNPDGFARRSRYSGGVDPNRSYPLVDGGQRSSTPCIENLIQFFHQHDFVGSIDFHAFGQMVIYPWGYTRERTGDDMHFDRVANSMSHSNGYRHGQISRILYPATGSSADYYYWKKRTIAFGVELARRKAPHVSQIPRIIGEAEQMTWSFLEEL